MLRVLSLTGLLAAALMFGCATPRPPNVSVKPAGDTWHCSTVETNQCMREVDTCKEAIAARDKGRNLYRCLPQPEAWCYSWVLNGNAQFDCRGSEKTCQQNLKLRKIMAKGEAYRGAKYADWSDCGAW